MAGSTRSMPRAWRWFPAWWPILVWLLCACPPAAAEAPAPLVAGAEIGFPPYSDVNAEGEATGFAVELLASVAVASGQAAVFEPGLWDAVWRGLIERRLDVLPLVARLPEREGLVEFTRPHTIGYDSFFVRAGRPPVETIEDARRLSIVVMRSDAAHHALASRGFDRQLVFVDSLADGFRLLASGQHDAMLAPVLQGNSVIGKIGLSGTLMPGPLLKEYQREFCFAVKKGDVALRDRLDRGLAAVKASGQYDRLYRKWLGIYEPPTLPARYVIPGVIGSLVLAAFLALWAWTLRREVAQRRLSEEALRQARLEAEQLARVKAEFLANMSHEIRTPLHGVLGLAQAGHRDSREARARDTFARILDSGRLLMHIIDDILDLSKMEAGRLKIEPQPMRLHRVLDRTVALMAEHAQAKGLSLRLEKAADLPAACIGDPLRLEQILLNLLANAVKFTEHGEIALAARRDGAELVFRVVDTGIGMTADQLTQLFQPFQQAGGSVTTRRYGGTGLGLAISKRLAGLLGGDLRADSRIGLGSSFELRLPLEETSEAAVTEAQAAIAEDFEPAGQRLAGLSILAAEDNAVNQLVIEDALVPEGAEVVIVGNGREAIEQFGADAGPRFDLVLMDVGMPEIDGFEATRRILGLAPGTPVIGLTGFATAEDRQRCLAAGMVDHVAKPFEFRALIDAVLRHTGRLAATDTGPADCPDLPGGAVIDWAALAARYTNRPAAVERLLRTTIASQGGTPSRLRAAAERGGDIERAALCHEVAGMAATIVACGVRDLARTAEHAAREGGADAAARLHELADAVEALLAEIGRRLATP